MVKTKISHLLTLKKLSDVFDAKHIYYGSRVEAQKEAKVSDFYNGQSSSSSSAAVNSITTRDMLYYTYCLVMVARYWASAWALTDQNKGGDENEDNSSSSSSTIGYFRYDIVMEAVHRKGHFDRMAFLLVAFLLLYCIAVHYIRNYRVDLPILEQQQAMVVESGRRLAAVYPGLSVSSSSSIFSTRNVLKVLGTLLVRKVRLARNRDRLAALEEAQGPTSNSKFGGGEAFKSFVSMVQLSMTIEVVNILVFVVLSKWF